MNYTYVHYNTECFCVECGNNSLNTDQDMSDDCCYNDDNIRYFCYLCNNYYNYNDINNICITYVNASNIIKRFYNFYKIRQ